MPKNSHDIRLQRCIEYRKTAEASLNGWIKIMDEEYSKKCFDMGLDKFITS